MQPRLNDDVLLDIFPKVSLRDLTQLAKCSTEFQKLAIRTFKTKCNSQITLTDDVLDSEKKYREILSEFGENCDRVAICGVERPRDHRTEYRNIRLFHCIWHYVNAATLIYLKVHPFELEADRVNFFGAAVVEELPALEELDLFIPLVSANLNCSEPFDQWCPQLRILRLSGHFGIDMPADRMPTQLHTIDIRHNVLIEQEHIELLIKMNRHTLRHLTLIGLNEIEDINRFLKILITMDVHRHLQTLVLQLRRDWANPIWPYSLYWLGDQLLHFQALKVLDIAGFGNMANAMNASRFGGLHQLEVLVISSPQFNLSVEASEEFLMAFAANLPPLLKEFWLKRMIVKPTIWKAFRNAMPAKCKCYQLALED